MSEDIKKENFGNNSQNKSEEKNIGKRTLADIVKETMPSYKNLTYSECYKRMKAIMNQRQSIGNQEALNAIHDAQKNFENTRKILASMLPNTPPLADRFKIQEYVAKVFAAPQVNNAAIAAYQKMCEALNNAALSSNIAEYKTNLQNAIDAEQEFSDSSSVEENEKDNVLRNGLHDQMKKAEKIEKNEQEKQKEFNELREETCDTVGAIALNDLIEKLTDIKTLLENFLEEFKKIAEQNSKSSNRWAWASCILSVVAIAIAVWSEWSDKTGELIEVVKKSHPWHEQQISVEDAKNISATFHAINGALQKNVQLKKDNIQLRQETARLEVNLKKAQDTLSGLEKKYHAATAGFALEKQKLYAEIAALKKHIEELKTEWAKRPLLKTTPEVVK